MFHTVKASETDMTEETIKVSMAGRISLINVGWLRLSRLLMNAFMTDWQLRPLFPVSIRNAKFIRFHVSQITRVGMVSD